MAQTPARFHLDLAARSRAIRRYALAFDHFSTQEQLARAKGDVIESEGAHRYAVMTLRAYRAEIDDPAPKADR